MILQISDKICSFENMLLMPVETELLRPSESSTKQESVHFLIFSGVAHLLRITHFVTHSFLHKAV